MAVVGRLVAAVLITKISVGILVCKVGRCQRAKFRYLASFTFVYVFETPVGVVSSISLCCPLSLERLSVAIPPVTNLFSSV